MMLSVDKVSAGYGDLKVLFDVSISVDKGECVALVGSNGAGKTTLLQVISGLVPITGGRVMWYDKELSAMPDYARAELGIAHVVQGRGILGTLSIQDNLVLGTYNKRSRKKRVELQAMVLDIFPVLKGRLKLAADTLSGGQQQMLAIGRALMMEPELLILDEPSLGLAPILVDEVFASLANIKKQGTSILIIEQNLVKAMKLSDRGYVLETGQIKLQGESDALLHDPDVRKAYLGI